MARKKRGRGRPPVYSKQDRRVIVRLAKKHGQQGAQAILKARNGVVGVSKDERELAELRRAAGFEKPLTISLPMIARYASEAGVTFSRGRRAA